MILSDLSCLQPADKEVLGGRRLRNPRRLTETRRKKREVFLTIDILVLGFADVVGNTASAYSDADAFGDDSLAETETYTYADDRSSVSSSSATSSVS